MSGLSIPLDLDGLEHLWFDLQRVNPWGVYFAATYAMDRVFVRVGLTGPAGPVEIRAIHILLVAGQPRGYGTVLRGLPFTRMEAAINQRGHRDSLLRICDRSPNIATNLQFDHARTPPDQVRPAPRGIALADPGGYRKPDAFYEAVADAYLWQAAISSHPAQDIAAASSVPAPTVHRWIREAKARGVLALPAHRGFE